MKIYIDRLFEGEKMCIDGTIATDAFLPKEADLSFADFVTVKGDAYLATGHLVLCLSLHTTLFLPCTICNEPVSFFMELSELYHTVPVEEISNHIFVLQDFLREEILLNVPRFLECNGSCAERIHLQKYLTGSSQDTHTPFSSL